MTLADFIDDHFLDADIKVYSVSGAEVGTIFQGDEDCLRDVRDYLRGNILRDGKSPDGTYWVYVSQKPVDSERGPVVHGYPGEVEDEAAFSLDWRAREPKASPKQVAFLYKNIRAYAKVRKPQWPQDPQQLLRYEASDAMTMILEMRKKEVNRVKDEKKPTIVDIVTYSLGEALVNDSQTATATVDPTLKPYDDTGNAYFLYGFESGKNDFLKNPDQNVYWTTSLSNNEILTGCGACEKYYKK